MIKVEWNVANTLMSLEYKIRYCDEMRRFREETNYIVKTCKECIDSLDGAKENLSIKILMTGLEMLRECDIKKVKEAIPGYINYASALTSETNRTEMKGCSIIDFVF